VPTCGSKKEARRDLRGCSSTSLGFCFCFHPSTGGGHGRRRGGGLSRRERAARRAILGRPRVVSSHRQTRKEQSTGSATGPQRPTKHWGETEPASRHEFAAPSGKASVGRMVEPTWPATSIAPGGLKRGIAAVHAATHNDFEQLVAPRASLGGRPDGGGKSLVRNWERA